MFGTKKTNDSYISSESTPETSNSRNLIGKGTLVKGEIICEGAIRIEGTIDGHLESKSKVIMGESGVLKGDIVCDSFEISGKVTGKIKVKDILFLKEKARVEGDIYTSKIVIDKGAIFNGTCTMGSKLKQQTPVTSNGVKKEKVVLEKQTA